MADRFDRALSLLEARDVSRLSIEQGRPLSRFEIARYICRQRRAHVSHERPLSVGFAAYVSMADAEAVIGWIVGGRLSASRDERTPGSHWEVDFHSFMRFAAELEEERKAAEEASLQRWRETFGEHIVRKYGPQRETQGPEQAASSSR